jgi:arylsulfatase A-like enzyme
MSIRNVLFITADQWRGDALSRLGHGAADTPHLDRLAAESVMFRRHYTVAAPCGPARASLLTGLYPFIHRSIRNGVPLDRRHTNLALEAAPAGFDPVLFGYTDSSVDPRGLSPGDPRLRSYEGILPGFRVEAALNTGTLGEWRAALASKGYHLPEPDEAVWIPISGQKPGHFSREPALYAAEDSDTAFIADRVIDYIASRRDDPWFAHVVFLRPHPPLVAPKPYHASIDTRRLAPIRRLPDRAHEGASHPFLAFWHAQHEDPDYYQDGLDVAWQSDAALDDMRAVYFGLIQEVDQHCGRIFDHLRKSGVIDKTLVIFTSDHGEMLGEHWCWGKGGWFDGSNHIPLIIRDPDQTRRPLEVNAFTESVDLAPTVLEWLGRSIPTDMNGLSLMPWLRGEAEVLWRDAAFWEFDFRTPETRAAERQLGLTSDQCTLNVLRDADFKYVHFTALPPLLYDLRRDPHEFVNRANDPVYAPVVARYAQRLLSLRLLHAERTFANSILTPQGFRQFETGRRVTRAEPAESRVPPVI